MARIDDIAFVTKLAGFEYTNYIAGNLSVTNGVPLFKGKNVQNGEIIYEFESYIPEEVSDSLSRSQVTKKCLLTPYVGTLGNIGIHNKIGKFHLGSNVGKIEIFNGSGVNLLEEYVKYYLMSSVGYKELTKHKKATAQESISIEAIRDVYLLIPPLSEQKRIICEIEKWLALIDNIEDCKTDIQETIKRTKSKILDLAIHGKLVSQDPSDEPASELLKRIAPDAKPCDTSHYENLPFEIPNSWIWVKGKQLFARMEHTKPKGATFKYIDVASINNKNNTYSPKIISVAQAPSRATRKTQKGDILFSMVRPYLRNITILDEDECIASTGFYVCRSNLCSPKYCYYLMLSNYVVDGLNKFMKGDNSPSINTGNMEDFLFPIPPKDEQERISNKVDMIFGWLNTITEEL